VKTEDILNFYRHLETSHSKYTYQQYKWVIEQLRAFAGSDDRITVDLANKYISTLIKNKGKVSRTEYVYAHAIKSLFEYAGEKAEQIDIPKATVAILDNPSFLYKEDVQTLIENGNKVMGVSWLSPAIAVSYDLALRWGECANLTRSDYSPETGMLKVVREKQKIPMQQILPLSPSVNSLLKEYLSNRKDRSKLLFVTDSQYVKLTGWQRLLFTKLCDKLGIVDRASGKTPTWHILRHTRLTWLVAEGKSLAEVAKFAGHANPSSTLKYMNICTFYGLGVYKKPQQVKV
jgi:integrase